MPIFKQDGLIRVSEMIDHFISDPATVIQVNQQVQMRVLSVDLRQGRIGLSMKMGKGTTAS